MRVSILAIKKHFYSQPQKNTFTATEIHNFWILFEIKTFHENISTLKFIYIYKLYLIKLSVAISDSSFILDSLSKAKMFPSFSEGNTFLFFDRFLKCKIF